MDLPRPPSFLGSTDFFLSRLFAPRPPFLSQPGGHPSPPLRTHTLQLRGGNDVPFQFLCGKGFDRIGTRAYPDGMKVNLTPELQAKLDRLAAQQGRDTESLVHEAVERLVGYDEWFIRQVEKGLAQIDRGEVLEHEEVAASMEKRIAQKQRRA